MNTDGLESFFTAGEQTALFLGSVLLGALLGAVYDIFRIIRIIFPAAGKKAAVMICDIIYMLIFGTAVFFYAAVYGRAEVRFYFAAGAFLGAVLFIFTVGNAVTSAVKSCRDTIRQAFHRVYISYFRPISEKICSKVKKSKEYFVECDKKSL